MMYLDAMYNCQLPLNPHKNKKKKMKNSLKKTPTSMKETLVRVMKVQEP